MIVTVRTGSRLHFGLFRLPPAEPWPAGERFFGGLGLAIDSPGVTVRAESGVAPSVPAVVASVLERLRPHVSIPDLRWSIESDAPEHAGFGTGTQRSLAIATAALRMAGSSMSIVEVAELLGRGRRSGIGIRSFTDGGFIVDGGRTSSDSVSQVARRLEWPADWRIVIVIPPGETWAGDREARGFTALPASADLRPWAEEHVVPAIEARDVARSGAALAEFNAKVGDAFAAVQGGRYSSPATAEAVGRLRELGAYGAGQSSWGPAAWGLAANQSQADELAKRLRAEFPRVLIAAGRNTGAKILQDC
jgi:beta-RFAP synthase